MGQEVGPIPLVTHFLQLEPVSRSFHNFSKNHVWRTRCSNTRTYGGQYTSKVSQRSTRPHRSMRTSSKTIAQLVEHLPSARSPGSIPSTASSRHNVAHLFPSTGGVGRRGRSSESSLVVQQLEASLDYICLSQGGKM